MKRPTAPKKATNDLSHFGLRERGVICPHCRTNLVLSSPMDTIFMARKTCPECNKDFVIENDEVRAA